MGSALAWTFTHLLWFFWWWWWCQGRPVLEEVEAPSAWEPEPNPRLPGRAQATRFERRDAIFVVVVLVVVIMAISCWCQGTRLGARTTLCWAASTTTKKDEAGDVIGPAGEIEPRKFLDEMPTPWAPGGGGGGSPTPPETQSGRATPEMLDRHRDRQVRSGVERTKPLFFSDLFCGSLHRASTPKQPSRASRVESCRGDLFGNLLDILHTRR